jgi:hypothetical protein
VDTQAGIKKARGTRRSKVTGVVGLKLFTGEVFFGLLDHMLGENKLHKTNRGNLSNKAQL